MWEGAGWMMVSSYTSLPLNCLHHPSTRYCKCATSFKGTLCVFILSEIQVYAKMNYKLKLPNQIILQRTSGISTCLPLYEDIRYLSFWVAYVNGLIIFPINVVKTKKSYGFFLCFCLNLFKTPS